MGEEKEAADLQQNVAAEMMANRKSDVIADNCAGRGNPHNKGESEDSGRAEVAGDQQDRFARHQQPGVFEHHAKKNDPVTVFEHVMLDQLKQIGEEIHSRNFTGIVRENLTAGDDDFAVHRSYNNHTLPE